MMTFYVYKNGAEGDRSLTLRRRDRRNLKTVLLLIFLILSFRSDATALSSSHLTVRNNVGFVNSYSFYSLNFGFHILAPFSLVGLTSGLSPVEHGGSHLLQRADSDANKLADAKTSSNLSEKGSHSSSSTENSKDGLGIAIEGDVVQSRSSRNAETCEQSDTQGSDCQRSNEPRVAASSYRGSMNKRGQWLQYLRVTKPLPEENKILRYLLC